MKYADESDDLMMCLFLDFAIEQALKNQNLVPYTLEMSAAARELIEGVELDDEFNSIEPEFITNMQHAGILQTDPTYDDWVEKLAEIRRLANAVDDEI